MIRFRDFTYESMMDEAAMRAALGEEMCGLLVRWTSDRLVSNPFLLYARAENVADERNHTYCVDPATHLWYARSEVFEIAGVVHSHIEGPAVPSRIDVDGMDPSLVYAIIDAKESVMNCWRLSDRWPAVVELPWALN